MIKKNHIRTDLINLFLSYRLLFFQRTLKRRNFLDWESGVDFSLLVPSNKITSRSWSFYNHGAHVSSDWFSHTFLMIFLMHGRRMMGDLVDTSIVKIADCRNILSGFFFYKSYALLFQSWIGRLTGPSTHQADLSFTRSSTASTLTLLLLVS